MLTCYKEYLQVLEVFIKIKKEGSVYSRLRQLAGNVFNRLLTRHPNFNFRINIMHAVVNQLSSSDVELRQSATKTVKSMIRKDDNGLVDFKLEIVKELHKVVKS